MTKINKAKLEKGELFSVTRNSELQYKMVEVLEDGKKYCINTNSFSTTHSLYQIPEFVFVKREPELVDISKFGFMFEIDNEWKVPEDTIVEKVPSSYKSGLYIVKVAGHYSFSMSSVGCDRLQERILNTLKGE
jgi:hypothetical protein